MIKRFRPAAASVSFAVAREGLVCRDAIELIGESKEISVADITAFTL
jgi:hypothetical protein